ncbi:uncharacterized protein [Nicotiana tomentosiformis]|uniref:uncharacterized protein n=1 Tax=Nicotiana tomentosiformis TaxID=4098 RepID=UPI00388CC54E
MGLTTSSFNPFTSILNQNKLEGSNYVDWKMNLDIVLTAEGYKFVITEECSEKPDEDVTNNHVKAYDKWVEGDEMVRCYILASMANVLQHQHQSMGSAYDMLKSLKEMFGEQNCAAKQTAMEALLNTKIAEGSSVRDHVLKMMGLLNELEVLGDMIDKESQVEMVLQTLPDSFQQFRLNYNMNKMDLLLEKLLNELQAAGSIIKQQAPVVVLNVEKPSVSKSKGGKKKKKAQKVLALGDSGATNHICTTLQGFQETRRLSENEVCIFQANEASIDIPLHYRSGRNINRQQNAQEQLPDILLSQSSGSNVEQPQIVEQTKIVVQPALQEEVNDIPTSQEPNTEPLNYKKSLQDTDADKWIVAMKSEMESMYSNQVADLVEPPTGVKPIGCRWIYNKKRGVDGKVHGISRSKDQSLKMTDEIEKMKAVPYVSAVESLMYAMLCTRPDICFVVGMVILYPLAILIQIFSQIEILENLPQDMFLP